MSATDTTPPAPATDAPARFGPRRREVQAALELFALCGIAVAQPTFDLLGKNTGIFATRGATSLDLILLALFIVIAPPLVLYVVEVLVGLVLPRVRRYVHALLCGLAFGVFAEEVLKRTTDLAPVRLVHLGWIAGLLAALAFLRLEWMRVWLRFLAIAPALFAAMFLFGSPASAVVFGGEAKAKSGVELKTPKRVVMVVFDEFPEMSLMNGAGAVDEELYPNFAKLASESTWYRNDTTVAPYTERAVPAILTGRLPPTGTVVPSVDDYPQNLFTMLGGALPFNVHEAVTALCPRSLCAARANDATGVQRLQDLGNDAYRLWRDFASPHETTVNFSESSVVQWGLPQTRDFVRSLQPGAEPRLDFVHIELPHEPWHLISTLQDSNNLAPQQGASKLEWQEDQWPAESARRQHLLQVQATDTVLGQITRKLKRIGAWDDTMVVVTADHGVAFTPLEGIRSVTDQAGGNYQQILWTPLFVKYPGQASGKVDDRPAESIDVLPTVAQVLGTKVPWKIDGTSLLGPVRDDFPRRFDQTRGQSFAAEHSLYPPDGQRYLELSPKGFQDVLASRAVSDGGDPKLRIYRTGPYGDLVGTSVSSHPVAPVSRPTLAHVGGPLVEQIRGSPAPSYDLLDPTAKNVPWTYFLGLLDNLDDDQWVAIALNGRIVGIGQALPLQGTTTGILSTVLAPQLATRGPNTLTLYAVSGDPSAPQLRDVPVFRGPGE
jgi:hypothetical protein